MKQLALTTCLLASPAAAQMGDVEVMQKAHNLGMLLASEQPCGLAYDQDAISAWIAAEVPAEDMSFASSLNLMATGNARQVEKMTASAKTAHCASVAQTAKHYGFTK